MNLREYLKQSLKDPVFKEVFEEETAKLKKELEKDQKDSDS